MMKRVKGVIMDVDGTLLDSMAMWMDLGSRYLKSIGIEAEPDLRNIMFSMSLEEGSVYLKNHYLLPDTPSKILRDILKMTDTFYLEEVSLKPGMKQLIQRFQENKIPMIVATTGNRPLVQGAFQRLGILDAFVDILTATDLQTTKHEPLIYQRAAGCLNTAPEETLVAEDMAFALETAKNAGFLTAVVFDKTSRDSWNHWRQCADMAWNPEEDPEFYKTIFS